MAKGGRRRRDSHFQERGVEDLAQFAEHWIKLIAASLAGIVGFLEFRNARLEGITQVVDNTSLIKVGLIIFFIGWGWGAMDDTRIQKRGYRKDPKRGEVGGKEWIGILLFLILFATLFFIPHKPGWFQLTLLAFVCVNVWTWRVIFNRTREVILESYADCTSGSGSRNIADLAKLLLVVEYMNGPWQRRRFVTLFALAACQVPIAFLVASGRMRGLGGGARINGVPVDDLIGYLPGALFILYALISALWMKVFRIRAFADLNTLDWLAAHFNLSKQRDCPLPEPHMAGAFDFSPPSNSNYAGHGPVRWWTSSS